MPTNCTQTLRVAFLSLVTAGAPLSWCANVAADEGQTGKVVIKLSLAPSSADAPRDTHPLQPTAPAQTQGNASDSLDELSVFEDISLEAFPSQVEMHPASRKPGIPQLWIAKQHGVEWCGFDAAQDGDEQVAINGNELDETALELEGVEEVSPTAEPAAKRKTTIAASKADSAAKIVKTSQNPLPTRANATPPPVEKRPIKSLAEMGNTPDKPRAGSAKPATPTPDTPTVVAKDQKPDSTLSTPRLEDVDLDAFLADSPSKSKNSRSESGAEEGDEECPGSPESDLAAQQPQLDDLPLEESEHPYDAPAGQSTKDSGKSRVITEIAADDERLRDRINTILLHYLTQPENVSKRGPWALMHAALPFGVEAEVIAGNRRVNALGWMCYNGVCAKQRMFQPTKQGFRTNVGAGVQGHEGQFLAILAQSSVQVDYPIMIGSRRYTIADLAKYEMATCREKTELTFKLIGLSHYLEPNQQWRDNRGRLWSLEKLVAEELAQPIIGEACGGTHRLMGLSFSLIKRQQAGLPITGHWKRSEVFLNDFVNYAMSMQNADGSFSTEWFERRGDAPDMERKIQTTGHILEWLVYTLPDEHLRSPKIRKSIEFVVDTIGKDVNHAWPIGPRGHALRALALYNQRVFGAEAGKMRAFVATSSTTPKQR